MVAKQSRERAIGRYGWIPTLNTPNCNRISYALDFHYKAVWYENGTRTKLITELITEIVNPLAKYIKISTYIE